MFTIGGNTGGVGPYPTKPDGYNPYTMSNVSGLVGQPAGPGLLAQQQPAAAGNMGLLGHQGMGLGGQSAQGDPYNFVKQNYLTSDEAGSTKKIWDEGQRMGWTNEQMGAGLGFSGQQVQDHFARYGLGVNPPAASPMAPAPAPMQPPAQPPGMSQPPMQQLPNAAQMPAQGGMPQASMPGPAGATPYTPTQASNPYLQGMGDDIQRRSQDFLGSSLRKINAGSVLAGGFGDSGHGIAQGKAISGTNDAMMGQLANLYGNQYTQDQSRGLQRYGLDQQFGLGLGGLQNQLRGLNQNYDLGLGGLGNQRYGMNLSADTTRRGQDQSFALGLGGLENQATAQDQGFFTQQRGQDLQAVGLGADLMGRGTTLPWLPLQNASQVMQQYSGQGGTTSTPGSNPWTSALSSGLSLLGAGSKYWNPGA